MPHECSHCGRVFSRRTALRNHIKTHGSRIDRILEEIAEESNQQANEEGVEQHDQIESDIVMNYEDQELVNVEEMDIEDDIEEEEKEEELEEEESEEEELEKLIDNDVQVRFSFKHISKSVAE
ncbi:MAG: C2H2-type zinc finger protein [Thaumarchaeota archaeon]|nr:MAG: C2H2-type zinc finger protein [Nitrososphaerota archaeon]